MERLETVCEIVAIARGHVPNPEINEWKVFVFLDINRRFVSVTFIEGDPRAVQWTEDMLVPQVRNPAVRYVYSLHNHPSNVAEPSECDHHCAAGIKNRLSWRQQLVSVVWTPDGRHRLYDERTPPTRFLPEPCGCFDEFALAGVK